MDPVTVELGAEGILEAEGLVTRWLDSVQDRNDQIADRIVYEATLALASMRNYCNQALLVHVPLQGFSLDWPQERRDQLREAWTDWRATHNIVDALELAQDTLELREVVLPTRWWRPGGRQDQQHVNDLQFQLAGTLAMFIKEVAHKIRDAKRGITQSDFDHNPRRIKDASSHAIDLIEDRGQTLVAEARTTVVRLRETVLRGRPNLPRNVWQQLDTLAFGGQAP